MGFWQVVVSLMCLQHKRDEHIFTDWGIIPKTQDDSIQLSGRQTSNKWVGGPICDSCSMGKCEKSHRATTAYEIMIRMRRWVTKHKFMRIIKNNLCVCVSIIMIYTSIKKRNLFYPFHSHLHSLPALFLKPFCNFFNARTSCQHQHQLQLYQHHQRTPSM